MRSPNLFDTFIVSVDLINTSTENFLHTITEVFANGGKTGIPELGVGNAEELVVFNAWERHKALFYNQKSLFLTGRIIYIMLAVTAFLTTVCSVIYSNIAYSFDVKGRTKLLGDSCPTYDPVDAGGVGGPASCDKLYSYVQDAKAMAQFGSTLKTFIVMLPIIAGFLGTVMTRNSFESKWKISYMSSMQICSEIFMFRTKVGMYRDVSAEEVQRTSGTKVEERNIFVTRIQAIFNEAMSTDVGKNGKHSI